MTYTGIAKGKIIEFAEVLPYFEGQAVSVSIAPLEEQPQTGTPAAIRKVMHERPILSGVTSMKWNMPLHKANCRCIREVCLTNEGVR